MQVKAPIRPGPFDGVRGPRVQVPRIASRPSPGWARLKGFLDNFYNIDQFGGCPS
jgi:hypothetical protein